MSLFESLNAWSVRSWFGSTPSADEQHGDGGQQPSPYVHLADDLGAGTAQTQQAVGGATTSSSKLTKQRGCCGTGLFSRCAVVNPSDGEKSSTSCFVDWFRRMHTDAKSPPKASGSDEVIWSPNLDYDDFDLASGDSELDAASGFDGQTGIKMSPLQHGQELSSKAITGTAAEGPGTHMLPSEPNMSPPIIEGEDVQHERFASKVVEDEVTTKLDSSEVETSLSKQPSGPSIEREETGEDPDTALSLTSQLTDMGADEAQKPFESPMISAVGAHEGGEHGTVSGAERRA